MRGVIKDLLLDREHDDVADPEFFRVRPVRASRKDHVCAWGCGKLILKGASYEAVSYLLDGKFHYDHVHDAAGACLKRKIERDVEHARMQLIHMETGNNIFFGYLQEEEAATQETLQDRLRLIGDELEGKK